MTKMKHSRKQYTYIAKFFRGVPVVTLYDVEFFTKVPGYYYLRFLKHYKSSFIKELDYWFLKEKMLKEFFEENPDCILKITKLLVLTPIGLMKLSNIMKNNKGRYLF